MSKGLTRRLFARNAAVAPLAAEAVLQQRASTSYLGGNQSVGMSGPIASAGTEKQWSLARALLRPAQKLLATRQNRNAIMGGLDPDILALRSISPSYKARMLAEQRERLDAESGSLWQWAKRKAGLPEDT